MSASNPGSEATYVGGVDVGGDDSVAAGGGGAFDAPPSVAGSQAAPSAGPSAVGGGSQVGGSRVGGSQPASRVGSAAASHRAPPSAPGSAAAPPSITAGSRVSNAHAPASASASAHPSHLSRGSRASLPPASAVGTQPSVVHVPSAPASVYSDGTAESGWDDDGYDDYDPEDMRTTWDVLDCEAMERGILEVECFVWLARVAQAIRKEHAALLAMQEAYAAEQEEATAGALAELREVEQEKRHGLQAQEHSAFTALRGMLDPLKQDIVERVHLRQRRVRRREKKIEELKHLHLATCYKNEVEKFNEKKDADDKWHAFVHKLYLNEASKLQSVARGELEAKYAAAEAAVAFNSPDVTTPARRATSPAPGELGGPALPRRPTLYEEMLRKQKEGQPERIMSTGLRSPPRPSPRVAREQYPRQGLVASPRRRDGAVGGDKSRTPMKHAYTPFAAFGPAPAGPFTPQKVYDRMG